MGSFFSTCSISNITLTNQKTSILLLSPSYNTSFDEHKSMIVSNDGAQGFFSPFGFPIHGYYDDYGYIQDIIRDKNVTLLEEYFGEDIDIILNNIGDNISVKKNNENYQKLSKTYFSTEVLEYLEKGYDKILNDKSVYTVYSFGSRMDKFLSFIEEKIDDIETDNKETILLNELSKLSRRHEMESLSYVCRLSTPNMFSELNISIEFKEEILKQSMFIRQLNQMRRLLTPSMYGSQEDNWVMTYNFNSFVNDLIVDITKEKIEDHKKWDIGMCKEDIEMVNNHATLVRDRKINKII